MVHRIAKIELFNEMQRKNKEKIIKNGPAARWKKQHARNGQSESDKNESHFVKKQKSIMWLLEINAASNGHDAV